MLYKGTQPICPIVTKQPVVETLTVTPSTTAQTLTPPSGTDGYNTVTVSAVTASIDSDIQAGNIKNGVNILGVTGNYSGITPTGTYTITANGTYDVTNYASANVNVSGGGGSFVGLNRAVVNGKYSMPTTSFTFSLPSTATDVNEQAMYHAFYNCSGLKSVDLSSLTTVSGNSAMYYAFYGCNNLTSVDLSSLTTVSGNSAMYYVFYSCKGLTSIDLSSLTTVSGSSAMYRAFYNCTGLTSVDLSSLTTISGAYALHEAFTKAKLTTLSFPSLTSTSFGSNTNQFNNMLKSITGCRVHFPSNLQSVIGSWSSVTSGFGGTNTTVLFDLPATT